MRAQKATIRAVVELEVFVAGEDWAPSRFAQEVQERLAGPGTGVSSVTVTTKVRELIMKFEEGT